MSTVIEKITLYDFFGYLIPGITFETLMCLAYLVSLGSESALLTVTQMTEIGGSLYIIFFLMGYVLGLILSEMAARVYGMKWAKNRWSSSEFFRMEVSESVIRHALVNSGLVEEASQKTENGETKETGVEELLEKYSRLMYSNIQTDPNYKRIHEYYSFATMCKNLSAAFALAGILSIFIMTGCSVWRIVQVVALQLLAAVIFSVRYQRFYLKKQIYTVYWFVAKNQKQAEKVEGERNEKSAEGAK